MYCAVASMDTVPGQFFSGIFIILWLIISRVILYDLFVVILMDNFKVSDTIELIQTPGRINFVRLHMISSFASAFHLLAAGKNRRRMGNKRVDVVMPEPQTLTKEPSLRGLRAPSLKRLESSFFNFMQAVGSPTDGMVMSVHDNLKTPVLQSMLQHAHSIILQTRGEGHKNVMNTAAAVVNSTLATSGVVHAGQVRIEQAARTLLFFHQSNIVRRYCIYIQGNVVFISLIYSSIFCSCFLLAAAPPAPDVPGQTVLFSQEVSDVSDAVFTGIFTTEMLINIIAQVREQSISWHTHKTSILTCCCCQGLLFTPNAYLLSGWNVIQLLIYRQGFEMY
jgi:hypothetical protein